jgi:hypothetical protein
VGEARSLPWAGASYVGEVLVARTTHKHNRKLARGKHSSLLQTVVHFGNKKLYIIKPCR